MIILMKGLPGFQNQGHQANPKNQGSDNSTDKLLSPTTKQIIPTFELCQPAFKTNSFLNHDFLD
jgi:hypothetical protein